MKARYPTAVSLTDLWKVLAYVWHALPSENFHKFVETMSRHMAVIIKAKGAANLS